MLESRIGAVEAARAVETTYAQWAKSFAGHIFWESLPEIQKNALAISAALRGINVNTLDINDEGQVIA